MRHSVNNFCSRYEWFANKKSRLIDDNLSFNWVFINGNVLQLRRDKSDNRKFVQEKFHRKHITTKLEITSINRNKL